MLSLNPRGHYQFNVKVICIVFAGVGVLLRGVSKWIHKQKTHVDDYWVLVSLLSYWAAVGFCIWGLITGGGGMEIDELMVVGKESQHGLTMTEHYLQSLFFGYILCTVSLFATKISILIFYRRIFLVERAYRRATLVLMVLATGWFISAELTTILACRPTNAFWDRTIAGSQCFNFSAMYLGTGIIDALVDVAILLLPIRMAIKLQLPLRTKLAVVAILALGGFVVIAQIFRLTMVYNPHGNTLHFAELEKWTNIHESTAIICACLPHCKPLMIWASQTLEKSTSFITSRFRSTSEESHPSIASDSATRTGRLGVTDAGSMSSDFTGSSMDDAFTSVQKPSTNIYYTRTLTLV